MSSAKPEIYIGSRIERASERAVLERLLHILASEQRPAIILANIHLNGRQIDAILALDGLTLVIEAKGYHRPVRGGENGAWQVQLASGGWKDFPNPYLQALTAKLALRDAMRAFIGSEVPFYPSAALVFVPHIPAGSSTYPGDFKVSVTGLDGLDVELQKRLSGCWNLSQWRDFACHHRLTSVSTLDAACDPVLSDAEALLTKYTDAYARMYSPSSEELIGFSWHADSQELSSEEVMQRVFDGRADILLRGPSGCGKTLFATRMGMNWMKGGGVSITIPAKCYRDNLKDVVDREAGLLDAPSASRLLRATRQLNRPTLLIVDGYNECQEQERTDFTRSISALARRYKATILVTSQIPVARPDLLTLREVEVRAPNRDIKHAIARNAAGDAMTPDVEVLLESVESGLEARLVGAVGQELSKSASRYALFDAFTRKRLGSMARDGIRALSRMAGWLSDRIVFSLSIRDLDRILDAEHLPTPLLAQLNSTNLLMQCGDRISFSHELFFNAFAAEAVIRRAAGHADHIVAALANPRHAERKEMIIGAIDDDVLLQQVLGGITDSRDVAACLSGTCGRRAREWAEARYSRLIQRNSEEVGRVRFMITGQGWENVSVDPDTLEEWSALDRSFISCVSELLAQGRYLREMLEIVEAMDQRIVEETHRLRDQARERKMSLRSPLFAITYIFQHPISMGLTYVSSHISSGLFRRVSSECLTAIVREKLAEPELSAGQVYLLLTLGKQTVELNILTAPLIRQAIERYWTKAPYHLQLDLMEAAGQCWEAEETERIALITAIEVFPRAVHPLVSTEIVEALQQLGALEASEAEHQENVRDQVEKLLSGPEDEESCTAAYRVFYAQFDHPLAGAYSEVVSELSADDRKRFLMMAAKGVRDSDLFLSQLIRNLASFNDPEVGEILGRWTEIPPSDSFMPQEAIKVFVIAHLALGRLGCVLPEKTTTGNPAADALAACGMLLYWSNRIDVSEDVRRSACHEPLDVLHKHETEVSVDAIRHCHHVRSEGTNRLPGIAPIKSSIVRCFPDEAAEICRQALHRPSIQAGYFRYFSERDQLQVLEFALDTLGLHGNAADLPLLRQFCDDANLGRSAIRALKKLVQK